MKTVIYAVFLSVVLFVAGCAVNPVTGKNELNIFGSGYEQDVQMGAQASGEITKELDKGGQVPEPVKNYVNYVGQKIAAVSHSPQLEWKFTVLQNETVNAFALPGGYIYITTEMLKNLQTESQLAAILSHEAIHVTARHSASAMSRQAVMGTAISLATNEATQTAMQVASVVSQLEGLGYSRSQEKEADAYGLDYLVKAGYNPYSMVEVMQILQRQSASRSIEFFSTHPNPDNREQLIREQMFNKGYPATGFDGSTDYAKNVLSQLP